MWRTPQVAYGFESQSPRNTPKSWLNFAAIKDIETNWEIQLNTIASIPSKSRINIEYIVSIV